MNKLQVYDNTRISAFRSCPRYYFYRHVQDYTSEGTAPALAFGAAWHSAMDYLWRGYTTRKKLGATEQEIIEVAYQAFLQKWLEEGMKHPDEMDEVEYENIRPRHPMVAYEMLVEYLDARKYLFDDPSFELISVEQPFAVPLDPQDPNLFYVGRLDKVFRFQGDICIGEHKTTTAYKKNGPFLHSFMESFSPNSQIDGYLYAANSLYGKCKRVMVDAALVHKDVHDGFRFIPIERRFSQLEAWLWETREWIAQIEANKEAISSKGVQVRPEGETNFVPEQQLMPYMPAFPKNTSACTNFGTCLFMDLCKMWSNPLGKEPPAGFIQRKWSPFDELKLEKIGLKKEDTDE